MAFLASFWPVGTSHVRDCEEIETGRTDLAANLRSSTCAPLEIMKVHWFDIPPPSPADVEPPVDEPPGTAATAAADGPAPTTRRPENELSPLLCNIDVHQAGARFAAPEERGTKRAASPAGGGPPIKWPNLGPESPSFVTSVADARRQLQAFDHLRPERRDQLIRTMAWCAFLHERRRSAAAIEQAAADPAWALFTPSDRTPMRDVVRDTLLQYRFNQQQLKDWASEHLATDDAFLPAESYQALMRYSPERISPDYSGPFSELPTWARQTAVDCPHWLRRPSISRIDGLDNLTLNIGAARRSSVPTFSHCNLTGSRLECGRHAVSFTDCQLVGSTFSIGPVKTFTNCNLDGASLAECRVIGGTARRAEFLFGSGKIEYADLRGASISDLTRTQLKRLNNCQIAGLKVNNQVRRATSSQADEDFNHIANNGSTLQVLVDWPDRSARLDLIDRLMHRYRQSPHLLEPHAQAIAIQLLNDQELASTPRAEIALARSRVVEHLLKQEDPWERSIWAPGGPLATPAAIRTFEECVIDLLRRNKTISDTAINRLLEGAAGHPELAEITGQLRRLALDRLTRPDQQGQSNPLRDALDEEGLLPDEHGTYATEPAYYFERRGDEVLAYSHEHAMQLQALMRGAPDAGAVSWETMYRFSKNTVGQWEMSTVGGERASEDAMRNDLGQFSVGRCFTIEQVARYRGLAAKQFDAVGKVNPTVPRDSPQFARLQATATDFGNFFRNSRLEGTSRPHVDLSNRPWLTIENRTALAELVNHHLDSDPDGARWRTGPAGTGRETHTNIEALQLSEPHRHDLQEAMRAAVPGVHLTANDQARFAFALATTYTKLTSSGIMGSESDSPECLRAYAAAMMKWAHELDPGLIDMDTAKHWMAALSGKRFSCTAVLTQSMLDFKNLTIRRAGAAGDPMLERAFALTYPLAWR